MYTIVFFNIIFRNASAMGSTKVLCWHCARIEERRISPLNGTNRKYITVLSNYRLEELHSGYYKHVEGKHAEYCAHCLLIFLWKFSRKACQRFFE